MNLKDRVAIINDVSVLEAELARRLNYKSARYFLDDGPLRRDLYLGAVEYFRLGLTFPERLLIGGNRVGKTDDAAYETSAHMTGIYPPWWEGRKFNHPIDAWTAGDTATTTRDIQQLALYGQIPSAPKTGFIPAHLIKHAPAKNSIPHAVESIYVTHITSGTSTIQFKSYDQRREAFQGTAKHLIWLDEECPEDIYTECLMRTLTCEGILMVTFTPIEGLTPFVDAWLKQAVVVTNVGRGDRVPADQAILGSLNDEDDPVLPDAVVDPAEKKATPLELRNKSVTIIAWDEVPHLSEQARQQMISSIPEYQRNARTRGIPALGAGIIYPVSEEEVKEDVFEIPPHWPRGYGLDVGWNWTAAIWGAYDPDTATWHLYHEHYGSHAEPSVHATGIKAAGAWIPGRIDPAANGRSQADGKQLMELYTSLGLELDFAPNGVEAGIFEVWTLITGQRIRVRKTLRNFFSEYRMYRRDSKGRVVKKNDHLMDAMRYMIAAGIEWLARKPEISVSSGPYAGQRPSSTGWMG
jgi:phage terminase large subunit-like protein